MALQGNWEKESGAESRKPKLEHSEILEDPYNCEVDLMTPESLSRHFGPHILAETEYVAIAS